MARLLIVDDEAPIRMLIRKYAEYEGHTADEAADGMDAVRLARGGTPRPARYGVESRVGEGSRFWFELPPKQ